MTVYELIHELQQLSAESFGQATVEARNEAGDWDYVAPLGGVELSVGERGVTVVRIEP